jgi:hypothetical protein
MSKCYTCGKTDKQVPLYNMIGYTGFRGKYWCLECADKQSVEVANAVRERFHIPSKHDENINKPLMINDL